MTENRNPPPPLSTGQRAEAAARGVRARQVRAEFRAALGEGTTTVADVLRQSRVDDDRGRMLARMKVVDLLSSLRGVGPVRASQTMREIGIAENRRVGGLGARQVEELTTSLASDPESPA